MYNNPDDQTIKELLNNCHTIAIVGLSDKPQRDSFKVANYLQQHGYRIIPVHPRVTEVLGEKAYKTLADIPDQIDLVNVFRKSEDTPPVVEQAVSLKPKAIWLQLGIANEEAAQIATRAGITFVQDRCIKIEHARLLGE
ncbi:CoA-binding domain protein [Desulfotomaculum nigrificans CO-1-SRB]|uniref:CoA-binding domain protein n=1 Tax=Desulfotomaculum nigrificans (strain DSM 14880 / VKM B-2319 / CO-1-SRB) TaxID=868595 RepID=F6B7K9_DESCC|nr:CoA-binding protein [Desulfotomaculum nigrificans]AEF94563.1 CoA-binding domain protein [Desulfotomaculum nigrificans CO-1-SRB]